MWLAPEVVRKEPYGLPADVYRYIYKKEQNKKRNKERRVNLKLKLWNETICLITLLQLRSDIMGDVYEKALFWRRGIHLSN